MENLVADIDERHRHPGDMVLTEGPTNVVAVPWANFLNQVLVAIGPWILVELGQLTANQRLRLPITAVEKIIFLEMVSEELEIPVDGRVIHFRH